MIMVYEVVAAESPPSFWVTTAQAVAVGQMMASIKPSTTKRASVVGKAHSNRLHRVNRAHCVSNNQRCQRCGRRSEGLILQKETKSMRNRSMGCNISVAHKMVCFACTVKGSSQQTRYASTPHNIATGNVQFFKNRIIRIPLSICLY